MDNNLELPSDIRSEFSYVTKYKGTSVYMVETCNLYSKDIRLFNCSKYYDEAGVNVPDAKYLEFFDLSKHKSIFEIGVIINNLNDVNIVKKFFNRNEAQICLLHLTGNETLIRQNFSLGLTSIMGTYGKILYHESNIIEKDEFSIQGVLNVKYVLEFKNIVKNN